ncbi:hypothetical protein M3I53_36085 [Paraburkholderia sp. CNPSo 3272]|uniref:hypothetical protein n=1 Tax=Paraburkholderia sp. CNPSo 3272 TaxID=2940931 RepID=UPI0020B782DE|nr:hypothetical protein [Paraburkholderia sp. CNPSo 3272]MCP3728467.1 hypothetical protein [Paraburkholderia sp. CNPSo 3272]
MNINWLDMAGLLVVFWIAVDRIKKLEAENRRLAVQCNTNEMNIKKLWYFRDIEAHELDPALSSEQRREIKAEADAVMQELADRNRFLMKARS